MGGLFLSLLLVRILDVLVWLFLIGEFAAGRTMGERQPARPSVAEAADRERMGSSPSSGLDTYGAPLRPEHLHVVYGGQLALLTNSHRYNMERNIIVFFSIEANDGCDLYCGEIEDNTRARIDGQQLIVFMLGRRPFVSDVSTLSEGDLNL